MKIRVLVLFSLLAMLTLPLSACAGLNLPTISMPAIDRQARDFGDFSGVTVNFNGGLTFEKISRNAATGGGNVWPLFNVDLQNDRLVIHLIDGRSVVNIGDLRMALNYPAATIAVKFTGGQSPAIQDQKTLYVGPNLVNCVGVAPQKCMQVKENPEDSWKLFYDQIDGFQYVEGYLYELKVIEEAVANPPADKSSLKLSLVEIVNQTPVVVDLIGPTWMLETLDGKSPAAKSEITAIFADDGSLYGSAGCNSYSTKYQIGGNSITIQPAATTMMACSDSAVMDQETLYLTTLEKAKTFEIIGYRLSLKDAEGKEIITYMVEQP